MKVSIGIGGAASGRKRDFDEQVDYVVEAEKLGVDAVWSAEAWGQDAISPLAYLAARTSRIRLGTGIMQISARVPAMIAMTALTMASISNDRFILGLGASGPQVVEGLQGRPFKAPLTRMKETVEIIKLAFAGEKIEYHGRYHELPLPGGQGKALRLSQPGNANIPIYLATLGPHALEYTGAARPMVGSARRLRRSMPVRTSTICVGAQKGPVAAWPTSTYRSAEQLRSATISMRSWSL